MAQPDALDVSAFTKQELNKVSRLLKQMGDESQDQARIVSGKLATFGLNKIQQAASTRGEGARRIADGGRIRKRSTRAEIAFGAISQKFSGGGTTQINGRGGGPGILAGLEFGSNNYKQFPNWSGRAPGGRGNRGYFIYPTLRAIQPSIVEEWTKALDGIIKDWA